ncbi:MAG: hypothetical protein V1845_03550 [bacterium]
MNAVEKGILEQALAILKKEDRWIHNCNRNIQMVGAGLPPVRLLEEISTEAAALRLRRENYDKSVRRSAPKAA